MLTTHIHVGAQGSTNPDRCLYTIILHVAHTIRVNYIDSYGQER